MAKINKTKYAILGVLSLSPGSGYDIKKFCDLSIAHFWNENYGHIYPVLKQLEEEELVTKQTETTEGKPPKHVYSLTAKGQAELNEWLLQPVDVGTVRMELLLKLFFGANIPLQNIITKLEAEKAQHQQLLERFQATTEHIHTYHATGNRADFPFWLATLNYGKHHSEAIVQWCTETLRQFEALKLKEETPK